jgi:uncharacterized protein (DUF1778 family)
MRLGGFAATPCHEAVIAKTETKTYPLRLPRSVKDAVTKIARSEGVSVNQFIATAVAGQRAAMNAVEFFAERRARADLEMFRRILDRPSGEPPRAGDERTP